MRLAALPSLRSSPLPFSGRSRLCSIAGFVLLLGVSMGVDAQPDVPARFAQTAVDPLPLERVEKRPDWRQVLEGQASDGEAAEWQSSPQRRRMSREERDHLRKHVRDAARDAYPDAPARGAKGR